MNFQVDDQRRQLPPEEWEIAWKFFWEFEPRCYASDLGCCETEDYYKEEVRIPLCEDHLHEISSHISHKFYKSEHNYTNAYVTYYLLSSPSKKEMYDWLNKNWESMARRVDQVKKSCNLRMLWVLQDTGCHACEYNVIPIIKSDWETDSDNE